MKIPKRLTRLGMLFASLVVALAATERAQAAPIAVSNHSFETPALGAGGWSNDLPVSAGLEDPQWLDPETPTNGNRFIEFIGGFFSEGTQHIGTAAGYFLYQNLGIPYEPNTTYTLTVGVGYRNPTQSGAAALTVIGLTALEGDDVISGLTTNEALEADPFLKEHSVQVDSVALNGAVQTTFTDVTVEFTTDDALPAGNIVIFLGDDAGGGRSHFDNVRLDAVTSLDPDGDKIPAEWETGTDRGVARNLDPAANDGGEDPDGDTLTNFQEFEAGTHPRLADTDGDGLNDNFETTTDPLNPDGDGDTLLDGAEIATHQTDPNDTDSDDDDFEDQAEIAAGTDPLDAASKPSRGGAIRVGANFVGGSPDSDGAMITGSAGVVAQSNWNNLVGAAGAPVIATNAQGDPSLMRVSWETNGPGIAGDNPSTGDEQLMFGLLVPRGNGVGGDDVITEITVKNIAYPLYDVYIYFNTDTAGPAVFEANDQIINVGEVTPFSGSFVEVTGDGGSGNYVHLRNLSGSTLTILGRSLGIAGFQIEREKPADPSFLPIPELADFGTFDGNPGPQEITLRVLNPGETKTLNITKSEITGDALANFTVSGVPSSLAPGEGADITVTFNPTDTVGIYRGFLEITSNDAVNATSRISLTGQIKHANGLLAHYRLDEAAGTVMEDSSGNGYNGNYIAGSGSVTLGAPSLAGAGSAVAFDEGDDAAYGEVPSNIAFPTLSQGSYSFWVKQDPADVGTASVLFSRSSSPANPYAVFFESSGGPDAVTWTSEATSETLVSEPFIVPGEAFHVVYTYSDSNEDGAADVALYVNGVLNASETGAAGYPINTVAPFQIGGTAGAFGFTGVFDDFQIYETILTEEQIAAMYSDPGSRAPVPEPEPVLFGYWSFDDQSAQTADLGPNGHVGTVTGDAAFVAGHSGAAGDFAIQFDGVDDSVTTTVALLDNAGIYSISGWVKADGEQANRTGLFGQNDLVEFGVNGLAVSAWTAAAGEGTLAGGNLIDGQWVHVVHVSGETNRFLYINGVQVASGASSPDARGQAAFNFNIGGSGIWDAADNWFRGQIDDVAVFSVALEPDEVAALADRSATPLTLRQPGGGGTNILVNSSFEEPVLSNVNTNNLGTVPTGWSQTGADATWNLIRNDGSAYGSGVDNAADGNQIIDLNGLFELFQNFTLTEASNVTFGASFANREGHDGSAPSRVGIYDASGTTLLSPEVSVDTSADPTPSDVWRSGEATVKNLPAGEYQIRIALNNFNNVDAVYANVSPATGGGGGGDGGGDRPSAIGEVVAAAGGMTSLTFSSEAGVAYDVERSVDLIDWSVVASPAGADGTTSTMVSVGNDGPIAFYRVVKK